MGFWIFTLAYCLLIPGVMLFLGRLWLKKPPESINSSYGYRTARSMKNQDTWRFAHETCGQLWFRIGRGMLVISFMILLPFWSAEIPAVSRAGIVVSLVQCAVMLLTIPLVEQILKRTFDEQGRRRQ